MRFYLSTEKEGKEYMNQEIGKTFNEIMEGGGLRKMLEDEKFFKIPKIMFGKGDLFKGLSMNAKLLYGYLYDRQEMAYAFNKPEPDGRYPIYCTVEEVMEIYHCGNKTAIRMFRELESWGLIQRVRQGMNRASKIYVKSLWPKRSYPQKVSE